MEGLLSQIKDLPQVKQKLASALVAVVVADAAAQPVHWVYKEDVMQEVTKDKVPDFLTPPANPFYRVPVGSQSMYGEQLLVLLHSLAKCKGLDLQDYSESFVKAFGPNSPYDIPRDKLPIAGPWSNRTMIRFMDLHSKGQTAKDIDDDWDDPDCMIRALAILLRYYGTPDFQSKSNEAFFMLQSNDDCLASVNTFMKLLDIYINSEPSSGDVERNINKLIDELKKSPDPVEKSFSNLLNQVVVNKSMSVTDITAKFSKA